MIMIIETNLSIKDGEVFDHQSRIVEAESWEAYVDYYKNARSNTRHDEFKSLTRLVGNTLPRLAEISEFKYDNFHLSCTITNPYGMKTMKLAYLC